VDRLTHDAESLPNAAMSKGFYTYKPFLGQSDAHDDARQSRRMTPAERQAAKLAARQARIERRDFEQGMSRAGIATFSHGRIVFHSNHRRAN
jgi:hypothetical protein